MTAFLTERCCRVCGGELDTILDLGMLAPSGFLRVDEGPLPLTPYDLCACSKCRLVQLRHTIDPDTVYRKYWYKSGINEVMKAELADIVHHAMGYTRVVEGAVVVDVGANDGTLLAAYPSNLTRIGFEPAQNLRTELAAHAEIVVDTYFPEGLVQIPTDMTGKVKILTSIACFYDLDDPHRFVGAVESILARDGVWVVQFQDWDQMQRATAFDNICMEHLVYYSLGSFERLIAPHGLMVIHAELRRINGGSYRIYVGKTSKRWKTTAAVLALRQREANCESWDTFNRFAWRAHEVRRQIHAVVERAGLVDVYGASTKFNTLAQWCDLNWHLLRQAWERSPEKWGLRTAGTDIPIVSEETARLSPPDALLVGIWQFRDAVIKREAEYLRGGGQMIFPLPQVDTVSWSDGSEADRG